MELTGFVPLVRRWWALLLAAAILAGTAGWLFASRLAPTYEAEVTLLTAPINTDYGTLRASGNLARTYAGLATSRPLLDGTRRDLGLDETSEQLLGSVTAVSNDVTRLVTIRVSHTDPQLAARIANSLGVQLTRLTARPPSQPVESLMSALERTGLSADEREAVREAAGRLLVDRSEGRLRVVDPAVPPTSPIAPRVSLIAILAAFAGLVAALALVLVREFRNETVESEEELAEVAAVPLLGAADGFVRGGDGLVVEAMPDSPAADRFRVLATKIGLSESARPVRSVLVVGARNGDGSGTVAANLAAVLSESGARVTLVDANRIEGEVTTILGLDGRDGYSELVEDEELLEASNGRLDDLQVRRDGSFTVLPRGSSSPHGNVEIERAKALLERLLMATDLVVLHAPPVDRSPSTLAWARTADATVLVVERGRATRESVRDAVKTFSLVGANLVGTVLRERRRRFVG